MSKQSLIVEALYNKRPERITESVKNSVKGAVKEFLKEQNAPVQVRNRMNNILNFVYDMCAEFGENTFVGGTKDYTKGNFSDFGSPDSGPDPEMFPSIYETKFQIQFANGRSDFDYFYKSLAKELKKSMKANFNDIYVDPFSITISIDSKIDDEVGYYISIERYAKGFTICLGHQVNPLTEGVKPESVKVVKYFKGTNPWEKYKFEFVRFEDKKGKGSLKVIANNQYFDQHDYAFIDAKDCKLDKMYSYADTASDYVSKALKAAGYKETDFKKIAKELGINESKKAGKSFIDDNESATGVMGTEVGLPIDKENCEGTDVSGVSTPNDGFGNREKVFGEEEEEVTEIKCPECGSTNINIHEVALYHCSDCGFEWEDKDADEKSKEDELEEVDRMLYNDEDEDPLVTNDMQNANDFDNILNPRNQGIHESATGLKHDFDKSISNIGTLEYNGEDFVEVSSTGYKKEYQVLNSLLKPLNKYTIYKVSNNANYATLKSDDSSMDIMVRKKVGSNDNFIISYNMNV